MDDPEDGGLVAITDTAHAPGAEGRRGRDAVPRPARRPGMTADGRPPRARRARLGTVTPTARRRSRKGEAVRSSTPWRARARGLLEGESGSRRHRGKEEGHSRGGEEFLSVALEAAQGPISSRLKQQVLSVVIPSCVCCSLIQNFFFF